MYFLCFGFLIVQICGQNNIDNDKLNVEIKGKGIVPIEDECGNDYKILEVIKGHVQLITNDNRILVITQDSIKYNIGLVMLDFMYTDSTNIHNYKQFLDQNVFNKDVEIILPIDEKCLVNCEAIIQITSQTQTVPISVTLNEYLLRNGFAYFTESNSNRFGLSLPCLFKKYETIARIDKLGIWKNVKSKY